jgi:hypothetical protein
MTAPDHAAIVREAFTELFAQGVPADVMAPYFAALDALVAERDEARKMADDMFHDAQSESRRAEAAEARVAQLEKALLDARPYVADPAFDPPDSWLADLTVRIDAALAEEEA